MGSNWVEKKVSEVIEFSGGSQPPKSTFSKTKKEGYIRLIQIRDYKSDNHLVYIEKSKAKKFCSIDDIMIGRYGPPVFQILKGLEGAYNVALMKAIPNEKFLRKDYLFKFLENPSIQSYIIGLSQRAAGQSGVNKKALEDYPILLPPLPEQKRIVAKLDGLFAKIDQAIGLLEENILHTQALMGSVLDEKFGDSKLKSKPIKELVLKTKTLSPKAEYSNNEFIYIDISSVDRTIFQIKSPKILIGNDAPSRARKVVEKGDVVFATTRPNLKNIAIVSQDYNNPIASTGFCLIRTNNKLLNNEYLFYFLISEKVQEYIQPFIKGAQYPAISDKDLLSIEIPILSIKEQSKIVFRIKTIFDVSNNLVRTQTQKLTHLKALKSSLLDQAFKGEL
jgi:type I restriction enzyme S subunit